MSKVKTSFFCQQCGYESPKWLGKCPSCGSWNTLVEEPVHKPQESKQIWSSPSGQKALLLKDIPQEDEIRMLTGDPELDRVLGGGIVAGSLILVAGEPGIGKSTLFLQAALMLRGMTCLYISGEESVQQIGLRAGRIGLKSESLFLLTETDTGKIFEQIRKLRPRVVIVDSIQTLQTPSVDSAPGSVSQIRECAAEWQRFAKATETPVFLIGHITKDGTIAGPKILEHMVDTVLYFEGDQHYLYRILRTVKNRYGPAQELGIYEMGPGGLRPVTNPSEILVSQKEDLLSGCAIAATMEGMRPLLVETQALVTPAVYGTPQRTVSGFDLRRLQLLLAVLEKRGGFHFGVKDVFLNIAGGLRIEDPSMDLAVLSALLSSFDDKPLPPKVCFAAEIGLSGEVRAVNRIGQRISEAEKLGFEQIFVSRFNKKESEYPAHGISVVRIAKVEELYRQLF